MRTHLRSKCVRGAEPHLEGENAMTSRSRILYFFPLLIVSLFILGGCATNRPFPPEAFPPSVFQETDDPGPPNGVTVNIYIQATRNMQNLLTTEGSLYTRALDAVLRAPIYYWGVRSSAVHVFRFDVQNQELLRDAVDQFAYRLYYPEQVRGFTQGGVSIHGAFDVEFYEYDWYLNQHNRGAGSFGAVREQLQYYPHLYITSVIGEIEALRGGEREISVVITNFIGNPNERSLIDSRLAEYLVGCSSRAVATFAVYNGGTPFYVLVLGSTTEVSEYATILNESLRDMNPDFRFFTVGSVVRHVSDNHNVSVAQDFSGMRLAFDSDIHPEERDFFRRMGTPLYYTVWDNLIDDSTAKFSLELELELLNIPFEMVALTHSARLMWLNNSGDMVPVQGAGEYIRIAHPSQEPIDGSRIPLDIWVDMAAFAHLATTPIQGVLVVNLDARLVPTISPSGQGFPHELLIYAQRQFYREIYREDNTAQAAEIFIHFIYR